MPSTILGEKEKRIKCNVVLILTKFYPVKDTKELKIKI